MTRIDNIHRTESSADDFHYQNRSLRSWSESLCNPDVALGEQAARVLVKAATELGTVLPTLAPAVLHCLSGPAKSEIVAEMGGLGVRFLAILRGFREALRTISEEDKDEDLRASALHALALIGITSPQQVPESIKGLRDKLPVVRSEAAQELAQIGPKAKDSIPTLISVCLNDPVLSVRVQAAVALWRVAHRVLPSIPILIDGVRSGDPILCWNAADCLGDMGSAAMEAVPALREALSQEQIPLVSASIQLALDRISQDLANPSGKQQKTSSPALAKPSL